MGTIRLLLACGVAAWHGYYMVLKRAGITVEPGWMLNMVGGRPVIYFYVVSGFLISYVLSTKYAATPSGTLAFYRARFVRIFPLWWAVLAIAILSGQTISPGHAALAVGLIGLDWIIPFLHYPEKYWEVLPSALGIAWTLSAELTFYLLAPLLFRSTRAWVGALLGSLAIRLLMLYAFPINPQAVIWTYFFFPATLCFFLLGHAARHICARLPIGSLASCALLAVAMLFSSLESTPTIDGPLGHLSVALFALALPAIFAATKDSRVSNFLGDLTYPLYLSHTLVFTALLPYSGSMTGLDGRVAIAALLAVCIATSIPVRLLIEIPAARFVSIILAGIFRRQQTETVTPP